MIERKTATKILKSLRLMGCKVQRIGSGKYNEVRVLSGLTPAIEKWLNQLGLERGGLCRDTFGKRI